MIPRPDVHPEFYNDVPLKRLGAFIVDVAVIFAFTFLVSLLTVGIGFFFFFALYAVISFLYRWSTLSNGSATWGMRLMAMEIRQGNGAPLNASTAFFHTLGTALSFAITPLQFVSVVMMLMSARGQGLTDHALGTVALNRRAQVLA